VFPGNVLNEGSYTFSRIILLKDRGHIITEWNDLLSFEILAARQGLGWQAQKEGVIKIKNLPWEILNKSHHD
jgi:hypothetical protein